MPAPRALGRPLAPAPAPAPAAAAARAAIPASVAAPGLAPLPEAAPAPPCRVVHQVDLFSPELVTRLSDQFQNTFASPGTNLTVVAWLLDSSQASGEAADVAVVHEAPPPLPLQPAAIVVSAVNVGTGHARPGTQMFSTDMHAEPRLLAAQPCIICCAVIGTDMLDHQACHVTLAELLRENPALAATLLGKVVVSSSIPCDSCCIFLAHAMPLAGCGTLAFGRTTPYHLSHVGLTGSLLCRPYFQRILSICRLNTSFGQPWHLTQSQLAMQRLVWVPCDAPYAQNLRRFCPAAIGAALQPPQAEDEDEEMVPVVSDEAVARALTHGELVLWHSRARAGLTIGNKLPSYGRLYPDSTMEQGPADEVDIDAAAPAARWSAAEQLGRYFCDRPTAPVSIVLEIEALREFLTEFAPGVLQDPAAQLFLHAADRLTAQEDDYAQFAHMRRRPVQLQHVGGEWKISLYLRRFVTGIGYAS